MSRVSTIQNIIAARVLAEQTTDQTAKKLMLWIADDYEELAARAAKRSIDEAKESGSQCRLLALANPLMQFGC